jgi:hypothetical protein
VDESQRGENRDDHHGDGTHAFEPGGAAEEEPPHDDEDRADQTAKQPDHKGIRADGGDNQLHEQHEQRGRHTRPEAEWLAERRGAGAWICELFSGFAGVCHSRR